MMKCKPVFTKFNLIYYRKPRLRQPPPPSELLPALQKIAKSIKREVEALCRLMTNHSAGGQMLLHILRWKKQRVRLTEADWIANLALSKKEIRYGKQALQSAGISVRVESNKYGRATVYSVDWYAFLKRLYRILGQVPAISSPSLNSGRGLGGGVTGLGVGAFFNLAIQPHCTDPSEHIVQTHPSNGGQTVITDSSQTHSHQSDDDEISLSESGEIIFAETQKEGRDPFQEQHDASRKFLEDRGVKRTAIAAASKHSIQEIERAFNVATQKNAKNIPAYALSVLANGDYQPQFNSMMADPPQNSGDARNSLGSWSEIIEPKSQQNPPPLSLWGRAGEGGEGAKEWQMTYNQLELQLDRASFDTWLRPARFIGIDESGKYIIEVHSQYAQDMLQHRLYRNVKRALSDVCGKETHLSFIKKEGDANAETP